MQPQKSRIVTAGVEIVKGLPLLCCIDHVGVLIQKHPVVAKEMVSASTTFQKATQIFLPSLNLMDLQYTEEERQQMEEGVER